MFDFCVLYLSQGICASVRIFSFDFLPLCLTIKITYAQFRTHFLCVMLRTSCVPGIKPYIESLALSHISYKDVADQNFNNDKCRTSKQGREGGGGEGRVVAGGNTSSPFSAHSVKLHGFYFRDPRINIYFFLLLPSLSHIDKSLYVQRRK